MAKRTEYISMHPNEQKAEAWINALEEARKKVVRHDDVIHTHMSHITITRPGNKKINPHRDTLNINLVTDQHIDQEYINKIAAHVRHVEAAHTPPKTVFNYWAKAA